MGCRKCLVGTRNTGRPSEFVTFGAVNREFFWPQFAADGTKNRIDLSAPINKAALDALINHEDPTKRLYPLPELENYASEREASNFEDFSSGRKVRTRKGNKPISYEIVGADSYYLKNIESFECIALMSVLRIDECGNMQGDASEEGFLSGIPIASDTQDPILVDAQQDASGKVRIAYDVARSFKDSDLGVVLASDFASDVDLLSTKGLLGIYGKDLSASAASQEVTATLFYDYSSEVTGEPATNLVAADFELENVTVPASTVPDTAVENPDGTYLLTFPPATFVATNELSLKVVKLGLEDSTLQAQTIVAGA